MTRSDEPDSGYERRAFGSPGAARTVIVLRAGPTATLDPDPVATAARSVQILAIGLRDADIADPAAFGGATRAESVAAALADRVRARAGDSPVGLVGVGPAGALALLFAAELGEAVDRLALIAVPVPETPLDREDAAGVAERVSAKTLIMNGQRDPDASAAAARWHHERLPGSRVEMVPAPASPDGRLALAEVWDRVLSHVAPGTKRAP